jgi:hypothetical protein
MCIYGPGLRRIKHYPAPLNLEAHRSHKIAFVNPPLAVPLKTSKNHAAPVPLRTLEMQQPTDFIGTASPARTGDPQIHKLRPPQYYQGLF